MTPAAFLLAAYAAALLFKFAAYAAALLFKFAAYAAALLFKFAAYAAALLFKFAAYAAALLFKFAAYAANSAFIFFSALASIWRMRSADTPYSSASSCSVILLSASNQRRLTISRERSSKRAIPSRSRSS